MSTRPSFEVIEGGGEGISVAGGGVDSGVASWASAAGVVVLAARVMRRAMVGKCFEGIGLLFEFHSGSHLGGAEEGSEGIARVGLAHEVFADEDDAHAVVAQAFEIVGGFDARLADEDGAVVDVVGEAEGVVEIDGHGRQVAVVDAEQAVGAVWEAHVGADAEDILHLMYFK